MVLTNRRSHSCRISVLGEREHLAWATAISWYGPTGGEVASFIFTEYIFLRRNLGAELQSCFIEFCRVENFRGTQHLLA